MNRRTTLLALSGAVLPFAIARASDTAPSPTATIGLADYHTSTLQYGTLAKATSVYAYKTSQNSYVQDFAAGEVIEQTAIAQALTSNANPPAAALTAAQQQMLRDVLNAGPGEIDSIYINVQIAGHQALLKLQEDLLSDNLSLSADVVHIALIAKAFIRNHLIALRLLAGQ